MSAATETPPGSPVKSTMVPSQNGATDIQNETSSWKALDESLKGSEFLAVKGAPGKIETPPSQPLLVIKDQPGIQLDQETPDVAKNAISNENPPNPDALEPFDWDDFQSRYDEAMTEATTKEQALLKEFTDLTNYFGIWAAAVLKYDDDRALKRLKTREAYIRASEKSLEEKKQHYTEVVEAFRKALALLGGN